MSVQVAHAARAAASRRLLDRAWVWGMLSLLFAGLALLPASPLVQEIPGSRLGDALFNAAQLLEGKVQYRDLWSQQAPLLPWINALGLFVGGRWGVWLLQVISLAAAGGLLFAFLRHTFGGFAAGFAVLGLFSNLVFLDPASGSPALFALPLQAGLLLLIFGFTRTAHPTRWKLLLTGVLGGLAFSLQLGQLSTVLTAALLLVMVLWQAGGWRGWFNLVWVKLGALLVFAGWLAWFATQRALPDLVEQALRYPLLYAEVTNPQRLSALWSGGVYLVQHASFFLLGLLAWVAALPFLFTQDARFRGLVTGRLAGGAALLLGAFLVGNGWLDDQTGKFFALSALSAYRRMLIILGLGLCALSLLWITGWLHRRVSPRFDPHSRSDLLFPLAAALLDLPLQLVFLALRGSSDPQYMLPLLPSLTLLFAFLVWSLRPVNLPSSSSLFSAAWMAALAVMTVVSAGVSTVQSAFIAPDQQAQEITAEVIASTQPDDPVLQWGTETRIYYLTDRPAPTRFAQIAPLFNRRYATPERIQAFLDDLRQNPPVVLVDTQVHSLPLLTALDTPDCEQLTSPEAVNAILRAEMDARGALWQVQPVPYVPESMGQVYRWVCQNYQPVEVNPDDPDAWRVYRLKPVQEAQP